MVWFELNKKLLVVSSLRTAPKPGYGLKSATLPAAGRNGGPAGMIVSIIFLCCNYFLKNDLLFIIIYFTLNPNHILFYFLKLPREKIS